MIAVYISHPIPIRYLLFFRLVLARPPLCSPLSMAYALCACVRASVCLAVPHVSVCMCVCACVAHIRHCCTPFVYKTKAKFVCARQFDGRPTLYQQHSIRFSFCSELRQAGRVRHFATAASFLCSVPLQPPLCKTNSSLGDCRITSVNISLYS